MRPHIYPNIIFHDLFSLEVEALYTMMIHRIALEYYKDLQEYRLWDSPVTVNVFNNARVSGQVRPDIGGSADHMKINLYLPPQASYFHSSAYASVIGHEYCHVLIARKMSTAFSPQYRWGDIYGRTAVNYTHLAEGLRKYRGDSRYVKSKLLIIGRLFHGMRFVKISWFDVKKLFASEQETNRLIAIYRNDRRFDIS